MNRSLMKILTVIARIGLAVSAQAQAADDNAKRRGPTIESYEAAIRPVLEQYCIRCHGEEKQRGDLRLDTLSPRLDNEDTAETWRKVVGALNAGDMPPKDERKVPGEELRVFLAAASQTVVEAEEFLAGTKRAFRRMSSREYINTVNDLLDVNLPPEIIVSDHAVHGAFDTGANSLPIASHHLESYLKAGRHAVLEFMQLATSESDDYTQTAPDYPKVTRTEDPKNAKTHEAGFRIPPWAGDYRVQIRCWAENMGEADVMWLYTKKLNRRFVITGTKDQPQTLEIPLNSRSSLAVHGILPIPEGKGQALHIESFQLVGKVRGETAREVWDELIPFLEKPRTEKMHARRPKPVSFEVRNSLTVGVPPDAMAERLFHRFLTAIQRGPAPNLALLPRMNELFRQARDHGVPLNEAIIDPMAMALSSPDFLYVSDYPREGTDSLLAHRLSYFLWASASDKPLRDLVERKALNTDTQ